jgi:hypothetical protein
LAAVPLSSLVRLYYSLWGQGLCFFTFGVCVTTQSFFLLSDCMPKQAYQYLFFWFDIKEENVYLPITNSIILAIHPAIILYNLFLCLFKELHYTLNSF